MTAVALAREHERPAPSLLDEPGEEGKATLDQLLAGLWRELTGDRSATCPWCGGEMRPQYGAHAQAVGGRCRECGSSLS